MRSLHRFLEPRVRSMNEREVKSGSAYKIPVRIRMRAAVWHYMYFREQRCMIGCWVMDPPTDRCCVSTWPPHCHASLVVNGVFPRGNKGPLRSSYSDGWATAGIGIVDRSRS